MKLTFAGAAEMVTGSCFHVEAGGRQVLVDCGMFQGLPEVEQRNYEAFPFEPRDVDWVILSHGHLDHLGLIPRLVREGFRGKIASTVPTQDIARIMLMDAAKVQEEEENGPLYTAEDALAALDRFQLSGEYGETVSLDGKMEAVFHDAGHILGAAFVELRAGGKTLVFSGDLGNRGKPLVEDPSYPPKADVLLLESTYGDRIHRPVEESVEALQQAVVETFEAGGNVIIPSFALERTQEVLYILFSLWSEGTLPRCRIFLDSPLATAATKIFEKFAERFPEPARKLFRKKHDPFDFELLEYTLTRQASKRIPVDEGRCIIIAGSGMCTGGRVLHHLRKQLPQPNSSVVFVGYQAVGTLGREISEGALKVEVMGSIVPVRCRIWKIDGLSAHADQPILTDWALNADPEQVYLVHGEEAGLATLAKRLTDQGVSTHIPRWQESIAV